MTIHIEDDQLQDYLDGLLPDAKRAEVERHLGVCAACFRAERDLRNVLQEISALPTTIQPERDLRPAIHARIDAAGRSRVLDRTIGSARWALAAAALLLVTTTSALTWLLMRNSTAETELVASGAWPDAAERFRVVEANYIAATNELEQTLQEQRTQLAPETVQLLEENLTIIDRALAEASAALRADPSNLALSEMLVAAYEKKLDLLRRAAQPAPTRGGV